MARYIALCKFWGKNWKIESMRFTKIIFFYFPPGCLHQENICSIVYFLRFFKIYPSANNPEEFELLNVCIVQCKNHRVTTDNHRDTDNSNKQSDLWNVQMRYSRDKKYKQFLSQGCDKILVQSSYVDLLGSCWVGGECGSQCVTMNPR